MKYNVEDVKKIVATVLEVDEEEVLDDADFVDDLGADSMKALELLAALEKEYKIEIPEKELKNMTTLNSTMEVLERL